MNVYGLEPKLLAHIVASCPSVGFTCGLADGFALAAVAQHVENNPPPIEDNGQGQNKYGAVFVMTAPDFHGVLSETSEGCSFDRQRWMLLVATKNDRNVDAVLDGDALEARQTNGPLVGEVVQAMAEFRWRAVDDATPHPWREMKRVPVSGVPGIAPNEYALFVTVLMYETEYLEAAQ